MHACSNRVAGLPDFSSRNIPKCWKIYQITTTLWNDRKIIPNGHKIYQHFPFYGPKNVSELGFLV
jgi:hypothetical protein